jgi:hypothetical protein
VILIRNHIVVFLFLLLTFSTEAQDLNSFFKKLKQTKSRGLSLKDSLHLSKPPLLDSPKVNLDSRNIFQNKIDSLSQFSASDTLLDKTSANFRNRLDSLKNISLKGRELNGDSLKLLSVSGRKDSLSNMLSQYRTSIQNRIDSLTVAPKPDTFLLKKLGSLKLKLDSLNGMPLDDAKYSDKLAEIQSQIPDIKISKPLNNLSGKVPDLNLPQTNLNTNLPSTELDLNIPELSSLKLPDTQIKDLEFPTEQVTKKVSDHTNLDIQGIEEEMGALTQVSGKVSVQKEEIQSLIKDEGLEGISGSFEDKVTGLAPMKEVEGQLGQIPNQNFHDPEVAKEMLLNHKKELSINHFSGQEEKLLAAMEQLVEVKSKIKTPEGVIDLFAEKQKPLKGKPFMERLIPGLSLQIQKPNSYWFDINPYLGFRVTGRFTFQAGWNQRVAYNQDEGWIKTEKIYGPRASIEFLWRQYLSPIGHVEIMNTPIRQAGNFTGEYTDRAWVWSYMTGLKTSFSLSKNIKGNTQLLYNLINPDGKSPYANRLNLRMGIEIALKNKKKNSTSTKTTGTQ